MAPVGPAGSDGDRKTAPERAVRDEDDRQAPRHSHAQPPVASPAGLWPARDDANRPHMLRILSSGTEASHFRGSDLRPGGFRVSGPGLSRDRRCRRPGGRRSAAASRRTHRGGRDRTRRGRPGGAAERTREGALPARRCPRTSRRLRSADRPSVPKRQRKWRSPRTLEVAEIDLGPYASRRGRRTRPSRPARTDAATGEDHGVVASRR